MAHRQAVTRHREPDHDLRGIAAPVLRVAPLSRGRVALGAGRHAASHRVCFAGAGIFFVDLEVQRGSVVEDELDIGVEQVGHPEVDRLLDGRLVRLEEVHRPIEVVELKRLGPGDAHVLDEPLLVAVELGGRRTGPVSHHGEQCPLKREAELTPAERLGDHLGDAQTLPELLEDMHIAVGPGLDQAPIGMLGDDLLGRAAAQDAARQPAQALGNRRIAGPFLAGFAQVHVRDDTPFTISTTA